MKNQRGLINSCMHLFLLSSLSSKDQLTASILDRLTERCICNEIKILLENGWKHNFDLAFQTEISKKNQQRQKFVLKESLGITFYLASVCYSNIYTTDELLIDSSNENWKHSEGPKMID